MDHRPALTLRDAVERIRQRLLNASTGTVSIPHEEVLVVLRSAERELVGNRPSNKRRRTPTVQTSTLGEQP